MPGWHRGLRRQNVLTVSTLMEYGDLSIRHVITHGIKEWSVSLVRDFGNNEWGRECCDQFTPQEFLLEEGVLQIVSDGNTTTMYVPDDKLVFLESGKIGFHSRPSGWRYRKLELVHKTSQKIVMSITVERSSARIVANLFWGATGCGLRLGIIAGKDFSFRLVRC